MTNYNNGKTKSGTRGTKTGKKAENGDNDNKQCLLVFSSIKYYLIYFA